MRKEEYINRQKLKGFFEVLFEYAKTSPEAMKEASDITFDIIKMGVKDHEKTT